MKTHLADVFRVLVLAVCWVASLAGASDTGSTGGGQPVDNEQPTIQLRYIIAIQGILPSGTTGSTGDDEPMLGEIRMFAGDFIPGGWKECNGELLGVSSNTALFGVIGTTYGGNGVTTFAVPDLRGRVPVGAWASLPIGTVTGESQVTLTQNQMPAHLHSIPGANTGITGASQAVNNIQPSLALTYLITKEAQFEYLGEIRLFAGNFIPAGWQACTGTVLSIAQNTALFSKLGTSFGGDGKTTFALPDLRGRTPIGYGQGPGLSAWLTGEMDGADTVTLSASHLPAHTHAIGGGATGSAGSGQAVDNMQKFLVMTLAIRHLGVFPTDTSSGGGQFIGEVRFFGFFPSYVTNQLGSLWALADGSIRNVAPDDACQLIVHNIYGGNGVTTAGVPEGRGRAVKGAVNTAGMGVRAGAETYTLTESQIPAHTHLVATVEFSAATYSVNQGATDVTLTLNRTDTASAASITVVTDDGAASAIPPFAAAVAGTDYTDLIGTAGVVDFAIGEASKTVHVTLIPKTPTTTPNKRFTATLAYPNAVVPGLVSTATIQILANDTMKPTLTVTAPAATATAISSSVPYLVKGTAGDAKGIDRVTVALNGGAPVNAVLGAATANTSRPFSLEIVPISGANTLVVTAFDLRGNSLAVTRNFDFTLRYVLTLNRVAPVGVALDTAGTVAMAATPSTNATLLAPSTANANPKTSSIVPGTVVKLTATAKAGYFFSHWDYVPSGATYLGNILTFTMPSAHVPNVTATFVANPFFPPAGAGTAFYGLIHPDAGLASSNATEAFFTGSLTATNGLFSGKVLIDGLTKSFIFYFYGNGYGLFNVGTTKVPYLDLGGGKNLSFYYSDASDTIIATIDHGGGGGGGGGIGGGGVIMESDGSTSGVAVATTSTGTARRAIYSATNLVPGAFLNQKMTATAPAPNKGYFTVTIWPKEQTPPRDASTYPQGSGFATLNLSDKGLVTLSGTLADGSMMTGSSGVVSGNECPIFVQLTTPGGTVKGGSFGGVLIFDTTPVDADVYELDLLWLRPAVTAVSTPAAAAAATNLYTNGWPDGISMNATGALYNNTLSVQSGLALGAVDGTNGNAYLFFRDGKLTTPNIIKSNFNINGNTVAKIPTTDSSFTLAVMASTGTFSGTFTPNWLMPATAKPSFKGIILQKGLPKGGYGFFISNAKNDLDPESGFVNLGSEIVE